MSRGLHVAERMEFSAPARGPAGRGSALVLR